MPPLSKISWQKINVSSDINYISLTEKNIITQRIIHFRDESILIDRKFKWNNLSEKLVIEVNAHVYTYIIS